jgi:hypothetical protein
MVGYVSEKSLEMRYFQAFVRLDEPGLAPSWGCRESLGTKKK